MSDSPAPAASPTPAADRAARLESLLVAATAVLAARQDGMLTVEEWASLAHAVAACQGRAAADYLTARDIEALGTGDA